MSRDELDPEKTLKRTLGLESLPIWIKHYVASIPLYDSVHLKINNETKELAANEGIILIGNSFNGVSVNDCIYNSMCAADDLLASRLNYSRLIATKF